MNKEWILINLREALDELTRTIAAIESERDYSEIEFEIAMQHLYDHVNTAWNSRNVSAERVSQHSEEDFYAWRGFPTDISMR